MTNSEDFVYINGLDATSGKPLINSFTKKELTQRVLETYTPKRRTRDANAYNVRGFGFDPFDYKLDDPKQVGWGLLVHTKDAKDMEKRLNVLIQHRNGRVLTYQDESVRVWKEKNHADAIDPSRFPYYILIAGSPEKVPFDLQFSLDVLQAVGRIDFDDNPSNYEKYAQNVVNHETGKTPGSAKRAVFFSPSYDLPTIISSMRLVNPLRKLLPSRNGVPKDLVIDDLMEKNATKEKLLDTLEPNDEGQTPAILFSASHGIGVRGDDPNQSKLQGSIVCQDHEFPLTPAKRKGFISGYDVERGFSLPGGIHFIFACYGAGSRAKSDFIRYIPEEKNRRALSLFQTAKDNVSYLPKSLLANPNGGALAVVGHVDPNYATSFISPISGDRRIHPFGLALSRLFRGKPVGFAVTAFNQKYSDLSTDLLTIIEDKRDFGEIPDPSNFSSLWICRNDAQNYAIIGDPAVHLRFE